jgi:phosphoribosylanthranilate isomerase
VARVGVFADAAIARVQQTVEEGDLDTVQLHGGETPGFCRQLQGVRRIKAFRIRGAADLDRLRDYNTDAWLLDSFVEGELGGTGRTFNWDLARRATELGLPVVLAGGLNPENVAEAIRTVRPFAVDVSSGVESRPGVKDPVKVRAFVEAVKSADTAPAQT